VNRTFKRAMYWTTLTLALSTVGGGKFGPSAVLAEDTIPAFQDTPIDGSQAPAAGVDLAPYRAAGGQQPLSDLTLANFFDAGWNDDFALRQRATGTPDYPLLRVQTNEVLRLFRLNAYEQVNLNSPTRKDLINIDGFIDYGFNRRFMIELDGAYQWVDPRKGPDTSGGNPYILTRFKLVDTEASALTFNFKVATPNPSLAVFDTTFTYGLTGFQDLAYWFNLDRVGLYYSFVFDNQAGPAAVGAQRNDVQYCVSVAKTVTGPDAPVFRTLTFFEENFAQTFLDGPTAGRTYVTVTPGFRFNLATCESWKMGKYNIFILGVDLPVSSFEPWTSTWRLSYIKSF